MKWRWWKPQGKLLNSLYWSSLISTQGTLAHCWPTGRHTAHCTLHTALAQTNTLVGETVMPTLPKSAAIIDEAIRWFGSIWSWCWRVQLINFNFFNSLNWSALDNPIYMPSLYPSCCPLYIQHKIFCFTLLVIMLPSSAILMPQCLYQTRTTGHTSVVVWVVWSAAFSSLML